MIIELTATATDDIAANTAVTLALGTVQATGGDASVKVSQFDQLPDAVAGNATHYKFRDVTDNGWLRHGRNVRMHHATFLRATV